MTRRFFNFATGPSPWSHFQRFRDVEFIKPHYRGLIVRAANWLVAYRPSH